jgi:hypothetical protein
LVIILKDPEFSRKDNFPLVPIKAEEKYGCGKEKE